MGDRLGIPGALDVCFFSFLFSLHLSLSLSLSLFRFFLFYILVFVVFFIISFSFLVASNILENITFFVRQREISAYSDSRNDIHAEKNAMRQKLEEFDLLPINRADYRYSWTCSFNVIIILVQNYGNSTLRCIVCRNLDGSFRYKMQCSLYVFKQVHRFFLRHQMQHETGSPTYVFVQIIRQFILNSDSVVKGK